MRIPGGPGALYVERYAAPFACRDGERQRMQLERAINDRALDGVGWENVAAPALVVRGDRDGWVPRDVSLTLAAWLRDRISPEAQAR